MTESQHPDDTSGSPSTDLTHPLARGDLRLAQDFLFTKISLLCTRDADLQEWAFEMRSLNGLCPPPDRPQQAFLFAYTLARYWSAHRTRSLPPSGSKELSPFTASFVDAVEHEREDVAKQVWFAGDESDRGLTGVRAWNFTAELVVDARDRPVLPDNCTPPPLTRPYDPNSAEDK